MERFSLELEATEVFYGKNQSCRACRETHRTGGNYANYDAIHIYSDHLDEALGRERTSTSALWARRPPERPKGGSLLAPGGPSQIEIVAAQCVAGD